MGTLPMQDRSLYSVRSHKQLYWMDQPKEVRRYLKKENNNNNNNNNNDDTNNEIVQEPITGVSVLILRDHIYICTNLDPYTTS